MANIISDETIEYVGILAKLELSDEEKEQAKKDKMCIRDRRSAPFSFPKRSKSRSADRMMRSSNSETNSLISFICSEP